MSTRQMKRAVFAGLFVLVFAGIAGAYAVTTAGRQAASSTSAAAPSQETFNRNMQVMRAQMMQLRATTDPAARSRLLSAHMQTMQDTLHMMMGRGGMGGAGAGMGPGMMQGGGMRGQGAMMGNGRMMQMMMGQMLQHQQAMQAMGCTK